MNKKQASVGWIALLHVLFTHIATILLLFILIAVLSFATVPLILSGIIPESLDPEMAFESVPAIILISILSLLLLWWSTANSGKIMVRRYAPVDNKKLLLISVVLFTIIAFLGLIVDVGYYKTLPTWENALLILDPIVFYLVSKKYFLPG